MDNPIDKKLSPEQLDKEVDKLSTSSVSRVLIEFLEKKVDELDTFKGAESVKEILGRQNAIRKLQEVINRLQPKEEISDMSEYK